MDAVRQREQVLCHVSDVLVPHHGKHKVNVVCAQVPDMLREQTSALGIVSPVRESPSFCTKLLHPSRPPDRSQTATDLVDTDRETFKSLHRHHSQCRITDLMLSGQGDTLVIKEFKEISRRSGVHFPLQWKLRLGKAEEENFMRFKLRRLTINAGLEPGDLQLAPPAPADTLEVNDGG